MAQDSVFVQQMSLLSLAPTGHDNLGSTRQTEELRMTPLFSQAVKRAAEGQAVSDLTTKYDNCFPQYGLLAGALTSFRGRDENDDDNADPILDRSDPRIFLNVNTPWSSFICGSQGSGKSHTLSCMLENCLLPSITLGKLPKPLAALVFHYDKFTSYNTGQICEAAYLCSSGIPVRVLVSPSNYLRMKNAYENIPGLSSLGRKPVVLPFRLQEKHLSVDRMMSLMAVSNSDGPPPLYMEVIRQILRDMAIESQGASGLDYQLFLHNVQTRGFSGKQTDPLKLRLDLLQSFMNLAPWKSSQNVWEFEPGTLTIVDLSGPFVDDGSACVLFDICLALFLEQPPSVGRVVALDEAHKFMTDSSAAKSFTDNLLSVIRLQRHLATRVIISTQEPTISPSLLELSSMTLVHRFTSPQWMNTLRKHLAGASMEGDMDGEEKKRDVGRLFGMIAKLNVGEALLFSPSAILEFKDGNANKLGMSYLKVRVRKRVTADGGRSILAN